MSFFLSRVFLLTLPFQFALSPAPGVDLHISRIFSIGIFLVWLVESLAKRRLPVPVSLIGLSVISFFFVSAVSSLWAENPSVSLRRTAFFFSYVPLFFVFFGLVQDFGEYAVKKLLSAFIFGAAAAAAVAVAGFFAQFFFGVDVVFRFWTASVLPFFLGDAFARSVAEYPSLLVNIGGDTVLRASGTFPDPHMFSFFVGMAFPVAVGLFLIERAPRKRWLFAGSLALLLLADFLSFSRGAYLGLLLLVLTFLFVFLRNLSLEKRKILVAAAFALLTLFFTIGNPVRDRLMSSVSLEDGSNRGRIALWTEAVGKIAAHPVGYGLGNYPFVVKPTASPREPIYAHNLLLDIATESGILGAVLFFIGLLSAISRSFRASSWLGRSCAGALIIFLGHSMVETPIYSVHILPVLLLLFACSERK